jgi:ATP-dependent helicase/DNAse subunit B
VSATLYIAPAAAGKTEWVLGQARAEARTLQQTPIILVPSPLQKQSVRRRLAQSGGGVGIYLWTFDELYLALLRHAGRPAVKVREATQAQLMQAALAHTHREGPLDYYAPIVAKRGLLAVIREFVEELKSARITPDRFLASPELGQVYRQYQQLLHANGWSDREGTGWLAVDYIEDALRNEAPDLLPPRWRFVAADGFGSFTGVQLDMLAGLSRCGIRLIITLNGDDAAGITNRTALRRFEKSRRQLETSLGIQAEALPEIVARQPAILLALRDRLFHPGAGATRWPAAAAQPLTLLEASNRADEVRAALRWLKQRMVIDGVAPGDTALLVRNLTPYRDYVAQIAAELGIPVRIAGGLALQRNPAVEILLTFLRLWLPDGQTGEFQLRRRSLLAVWRSAYFSWPVATASEVDPAIATGDADQPALPITPALADALDGISRTYQVLGGHAQWAEAFVQAARQQIDEETLADFADERENAVGESGEGDEGSSPSPGSALLLSLSPAALHEIFEHFVARCAPPPGAQPLAFFAGWLEDLIGGEAGEAAVSTQRRTPNLHMLEQLDQSDPAVRHRDRTALGELKNCLRGLLQAEEAVAAATATMPEPATYPAFFQALLSLVAGASYEPASNEQGCIVATAAQFRGVSADVVAVLGLAEGEFPARLAEDPFLRDNDRSALAVEAPNAFRLAPSLESIEPELFYETVTRARRSLLVTRPRLAEGGAEWEPSPYWRELLDRTGVQPLPLPGESTMHPADAASPAELQLALVRTPHAAGQAWLARNRPQSAARIAAGAAILRDRRHRSRSRHNGDLSEAGSSLVAHYTDAYIWSPSKLETYLGCGFRFLTSNVLKLAPRQEPATGIDNTQLGAIYHAILEELFDGPASYTLEEIGRALPEVAERVFATAPGKFGFRATRYWAQTRDEILGNIMASLSALAATDQKTGAEYETIAVEARFADDHPLRLEKEGRSVLVRGFIDRVDRNRATGQLRVIDYKTAGAGFDNKALLTGKKIQLPLYALAAEESLGLGEVAEGFYWHLRQAKPSSLTLTSFTDEEGAKGIEAAVAVARDHIFAATDGIRSGAFRPEPPSDGCPAFCPAAVFCHRFRPSR